jgi:outer membrane protein OmpA-like peptidoglycan-associated protein
MGGLDIFYSKLDENKKWTTPVNIGYPINSEKDEVDFFVSLNGKTGYFSSNNIENNDWNIYEFELYEKARPLNMAIIKGEVIVEDGDYKGAIVELRDTAANIISSTELNQYTGQYAIATEIHEDKPADIIINVKKTGHAFDTKIINTSNMVNNVIKSDAEIKKVETGKEYQLHDIHFGTNLYNLNSHSKYIINLFVEFLTDNPTVKVEIQGHTDNVGNDADNLLLSERRAKSVYDYVISKGISPERVRHKGYGRTKPVATNDTEEGRAKNRRTIFLIYEQ